MSTKLDRKIEALTKSVTDLASEMRDKSDIPLDRIEAIEAEITAKSAAIDELLADKKQDEIESKIKELDDRVKAFTRSSAQSKPAAILAGASYTETTIKSVGRYSETNFLSALVARRYGDADAVEFVKAVLGTSAATGQGIVPGNFVSDLVTALSRARARRSVLVRLHPCRGADHGQDGRGDGGAHRGRRRGAHHLRHVQGR